MAVDQRRLARQRADFGEELSRARNSRIGVTWPSPSRWLAVSVAGQDDMHAARLAGLEQQFAVGEAAHLAEPAQPFDLRGVSVGKACS